MSILGLLLFIILFTLFINPIISSLFVRTNSRFFLKITFVKLITQQSSVVMHFSHFIESCSILNTYIPSFLLVIFPYYVKDLCKEFSKIPRTSLTFLHNALISMLYDLYGVAFLSLITMTIDENSKNRTIRQRNKSDYKSSG